MKRVCTVAACALFVGCAPSAPAFPPAGEDTGAGTAAPTSSTAAGADGVRDSGSTLAGGASSSWAGDATTGEPSICGDGVVEGDEECDLGVGNGTGKACRADCRLDTCPDGYLGPGEACDDGNLVDDDRCSNTCGPASCGDGVLQAAAGEQCDDGVDNSLYGACLPSCVAASCGDGWTHMGVEACDNGNGGETCASLGFGDGVLVCTAKCDFDTSGCCLNLGGTCQADAGCCDPAVCNGGSCCVPVGGSCTVANDCCSGECSAASQLCFGFP